MARSSSSSSWLPSSWSLITCLLILAFVGSAISLTCYKCKGKEECAKSSLDEEKCEDDLPASAKPHICLYVRDPKYGPVRSRGCGNDRDENDKKDDDGCWRDVGGGQHCPCNTDRCNKEVRGGGGGGYVAKSSWLWTTLLSIGATCFYILSKGM